MEQIKIIQVTPEQLQKSISDILRTQLEEFSKTVSSKDPDELLTRKETAELLKINLATLWSWTKSGKLNSLGLGNRVYYKRSEIEMAFVEIN